MADGVAVVRATRPAVRAGRARGWLCATRRRPPPAGPDGARRGQCHPRDCRCGTRGRPPRTCRRRTAPPRRDARAEPQHREHLFVRRRKHDQVRAPRPSPARRRRRSGVDLPRACRTRASSSSRTCSAPTAASSALRAAFVGVGVGRRIGESRRRPVRHLDPEGLLEHAGHRSDRVVARAGSPQPDHDISGWARGGRAPSELLIGTWSGAGSARPGAGRGRRRAAGRGPLGAAAPGA